MEKKGYSETTVVKTVIQAKQIFPHHIQKASHQVVPHCEFVHFVQVAVVDVEVKVDAAGKLVDDLTGVCLLAEIEKATHSEETELV